MLPRRLRLRRPQDFETIRREGQRWSHPLLQMGCLSNQYPHNRFGIVVSKRIGKAVVRNRLRRRLREIIRKRNDQLTQGCDIVIVARAHAAAATFQELDAALGDLFTRACLLVR